MAFISSLAMWFSNSGGELVIEWFGWQITTTPAFFISFINFHIFVYMTFFISIKLNKPPKKYYFKI